MALAYTAPTWENGGGVGISASQLQALSDCMEGLVQGSDKAITNIAISGQTITLTFADGSEETGTASGLKGISRIAKTGTSGNVDTYTITYTDGSTSTFTVTNGADGSFYIVTAGIKSTDDPYGNIEYYIGGDFYKNGVLYNQSAFYKVTLVDETEYPPSPYLIDDSSGTFTNGHYSTGSIGGIPSGATITTQIFTDNTMATLLGEVKVLIGLQGSEGEQGPQGPAGDDGVSPEVTITTITGGHRVNITDAEHPGGQSFDVMDGANTVVPNPQGTSVGDLTSIGINGDKYDIQGGGGGTDENAYHIGDTAETALADSDYFPFYDTSASAKRNTLWSNIKSVLKTYFDTLYTKTVANPQGTATGTLTKLGIGSDIYEIQGGGGSSDKADKTDIAPVENGTTASKAYAIGQQFYLSDGKLYKCKQPIAQGATFTIGTNCELADCVTEQLLKNVNEGFKKLTYTDFWIDSNTKVKLKTESVLAGAREAYVVGDWIGQVHLVNILNENTAINQPFYHIDSTNIAAGTVLINFSNGSIRLEADTIPSSSTKISIKNIYYR